uniref:Myosin-VIIa n=1 Tax=Schistocephalus solidus TaxID=70667 RepID=A0A0X3P9S8_SCHSO
MVVLAKGDYIWIKPTNRGEFSVPVGARVLEVKNGSYLIQDDDGNTFNIDGDTECHLMHPSSVKSMPDMIALGELTECGILRNLYLRYQENQIYTYTGSILIAINPYRPLPIYSLDTMKEYSNKGIGELPPHLFAIGDNAYRNMRKNLCDQCIIISGESGAGKTESTKLLLQFITTVSGKKSCIGKQILDSNPIMEAFGNAKTVRNDNSSRFGKYVDVHFDQTSGRIVSARIEQYLLEKSRIVTQAPGERNYHAFYCMLAGMKAEKKNQLGLKDVSAYNYLVQNENVCDNKNDANHFETIMSTMKYLKFRERQIDEIWNLLAAILHLGNISFCETLKESADASKIVDSNRSELRYASSLLGMSPGCLERALTTKRLLTAGECVVAQILPATAHTVRDAFAKTIYDQLFKWIVEKINAAIYHPLEGAQTKMTTQAPPSRHSTSRPVSLTRISDDRRSASLLVSGSVQKTGVAHSDTHWTPIRRSRSKAADLSENKDADSPGMVNTPILVSSAGPGRVSIGVLDIFGFENFTKNSFEQLCINYANENIQQYFVRHIFKLEQEEYLAENINWTHINFQDNQEVLDLIAYRPLNILSLIDEESRFPQGTDESFLNKLNSRHSNTPNYVRSLSTAEKRFGIRHFAGPVFYEVEGFLEKNRDTFNHDLLDVIGTSKNAFLRELFEERLNSSCESRSRSLTLSMQFKRSLERLLQIINGCHPFFVRCIKPNELKLPNCFDRELCVRQLRYSGMMETIQIRRLGYPIRYKFADFTERFRVILRPCPLPQRHTAVLNNMAELICRTAFGFDTTYAVGKNKVFLRTAHDGQLECLREKILNEKSAFIQSRWKGAKQRQQYIRLREATIFCQLRFRKLAERRHFLKFKRLVIRMQANVRAHQAKVRLQQTMGFIVSIQSMARRWLAIRGSSMLAKRKKYVHAESVIQQNHNVKLDTCDSILSVDTPLNRAGNAFIRICPLLEGTLRITRVVKAAPEEFNSTQLVSSVDESIGSRPTQIAKVYSSADFDNLVDEIFGGIFDSVHEDKMARTLPLASSVTVTEKGGDRPAVHIHDQGHGICQLAENSRVKAQFTTISQKITDSLPSELVSEGDRASSIQNSTDESSVASQPSMNECSFLKFAAAYFQTGSTPFYTASRLVRPLLKHRNQCDLLLALDIFSRIQAFMKPKARDKERLLGKQVWDSTLDTSKRQNHRTPLPTGDDDTFGERQKPSSSIPTFAKRKRVASSIDGFSGASTPSFTFTHAQNASENGRKLSTSGTGASEGNLLSDLQIARFIVKAGIEHPLLRDEIYCQILKQINKNPCDLSRRKGWVLLSLCASCFPPIHFETPLREYLKANPSSFSRACLKRLNRLHQTGTRSKPPSYMELRAAEENKSLVINIHCADNTQVKIKVDPAVTVEELSTNAFKAICLQDTFGFEIFINIFEKSYSLSSGPKHLFDTISFCEQHARSQGLEESELPWSFSIRKTIFAPWHDVRYDPVATTLICYQVCQQCFTEAHESLEEHELAFLLASMFRLFHTDMQSNPQLDRVGDSADINSWLAEILSADCDLKYWQKVVGTALRELQNRYPSPTIEGMRQTIVTFAKLQWVEIFTREFEVKVLVDDTTSYDAILGIESNGVHLYDESGKHQTVLNFVEIHSVCVNPMGEGLSKVLSIQTVWMKEYRCVTNRADDIKDVLVYLLTGLRQQSRYAVAMKEFCASDLGDRKSAQLRPGDVLVLDCLGWELDPKVEPIGVPRPPASDHPSSGGSAVQDGFCCGENRRTLQTGWFPISHIYVLPTLGVPKPEFINAFSQLISSADNQDWLSKIGCLGEKLRKRPTPKITRPVSLTEAFFCNNSRSHIDAPGSHDRLSSTHILEHEAARRSTTPSTPTAPLNTLQHSRLPLKFPFVCEVATANRKIYEAAVLAFCIIQVYMGDCEKVPLPLKDVPAIVLTDLLFGSALNCPLLRDELFMQLMNQLTKNPTRQSEDKGWELLWLASGVILPSDRLLNKLICFLHRSSHAMAPQCYIRLHHTKSRGNRKKPPHPMELAAVRERKSKFSQKVVLPDGKCIIVFLQSDTKGPDIVDEICLELGLGSRNEFAVYVDLDGEKRCIEDEDFVLDCLYLTLPDMSYKSKRPLLALPSTHLYFKRKLWLHSLPGLGSVSDNVIDSHQELENFLQGYHRCSFEQFLELSTLIYIWRGQRVSPEQILPRTMLSHIYEPDWIERLANVANQGPQLSPSDAPLAFLKSLATVPTFGSAFFDVQSAEIEEEWILAVNKEKVSVWPRCRELKPLEYPLRDILKCWPEHNILNFRLRNSNTLHQWVCTEITAFNAANLIRCYIQRHIMQLPSI